MAICGYEFEDGDCCGQVLGHEAGGVPHIPWGEGGAYWDERREQRSKTCVVVIYNAPEESRTCGEPVAGERGGFPMCEFHLDLFGPEN